MENNYLTGYTFFMPGEERSRIEDMKKRLYVRGAESLRLRRRVLHSQQENVPPTWTEESHLEKFSGPPRESSTLVNRIFLFSVLFFVVSAGISAFFFFGGATSVSSQNIDIEVQGPSTIGGGEALQLEVAVTNKNAVSLELADILVEYPAGTRSAEDLKTPLPRTLESLGTILSRESVHKTFQAVLFGEENKPAEISITVEYRLQGSNAIFYKETKHSILLSSAPLRLSVKALKETTSGQPADFTVTVESNTTSVLKNILLVAEYPAGFTYKGADPKPSFGNSAWSLGDIPVKGKRSITIHGVLSGQADEERVLRFSAGVPSDTDEKTLITAFVTSANTITIKRPFLSTSIALNGEVGSDFTAARGRTVRADLTWTNNTSAAVTDAEIKVTFKGAALDKESVSPDRGFYRSIDTTILWDKNSEPELSFIEPGQSGIVSFTFAPLRLDAGVLRNPTILITVDVSGTRSSEANVPEKVTSSESREIKVASDLLLASQAVYFSGPFTNTGPLPPKTEVETTYTIIWTLTNSSNTASNVTVTASLPSYVRWVGNISPAAFPTGENLDFNKIGGTVTWSLGSVPAGVGDTASPKQIAFQIGFTPSLSQVGTSPALIGDQRLQGLDQFTDTLVGDTRPALTTLLRTDPTFRSEQGIVVK